MKIGIISDTHDNIQNIKKVIQKLKEERVEAVIHCGDFCAPFSVALLKELGVPVHAVFGNVDGDKVKLLERKPQNVIIHGEFGEIKLDNRKIAFVHYPEIAKALAIGNKYGLVCYGHKHISIIEKISNTIFVNPGEVTNFLGKSSYTIYDTIKNTIQIKHLMKK